MLNILFPAFCSTCDRVLLKQEPLLCSYCLNELPLTHFHKLEDCSISDKFYGLLPLYQATALLYFVKRNITQKLLHQLKYEGQQDIGVYFGRWLGSELGQIASYADIEVVVPVPLHKKRLRSRGYNQVKKFAQQIALELQATYCEKSLIKTSNVASQVKLAHQSRFKDRDAFQLGDPKEIQNKHVLLVDDIITTGSTLFHCGKQLLKAPIAKLSIATLAVG